MLETNLKFDDIDWIDIKRLFVLELWDEFEQEDAGTLYLDNHLSEDQKQHICEIISQMREFISDWNYDDIAEAITRYLNRNGIGVLDFESETFLV